MNVSRIIHIQIFTIFFISYLFFTPTANALSVIATITVGPGPTGIAYDSALGKIFVSNANGTVSVIDSASNSVIATITVGLDPRGIAYDSALGKIFVTNSGNGTVSVIDSASNSVIVTITVGSGPTGIAYDSALGKIFVTNIADGTVSVINSTNSVIETITVGPSPISIAYDSALGKIFVANNGVNTVSVIDSASNSVIETITVGLNPFGIAYDSALGKIFVANNADGTVSVIDSASNSVIETITVGLNPFGIAYDSAMKEIFVANIADSTVSVIDSASNSVIETITVGLNPFGIAYDSTLNKIFVTNNGNGTVSVIPNPPPLVNNGGGSSGEWTTKPTFGVSYQTNNQFVTDGFGYDVFAKTITDNFHTGFSMVDIPTDTSYPLYAKGYFANQLKIQEFCFGIPETGKGYLAESCIEVHFDSGFGSDRKITYVKVIQDSNVIDDVSVQHEMASCNTTDTVKVCDKTMITIAFAEPLQHTVMMIKGIDWKGKSTETYLNEGFNIAGKQLTDLPTMMIPSPTKYEGLIKVTQSEKYSDIWISDDGKMFERNDFGSFNQINQTYERHQDTGDARTRIHSAFAEWKEQQAFNAKSVFNSDDIQSVLPDSFTIVDEDGIDKREKFLIDHNMMWLRK